MKPVVFSSLYPVMSDDYESLKDSLERYRLNDASLTYQKDSSAALGQGSVAGSWGCCTWRSCRSASSASSTSRWS